MHMAIRVQENVVQFEIPDSSSLFSFFSPIDDVLGMKELKGDDDLAGIESRASLVELLDSLDVMHQISAVEIFHDKEEILLQHVALVSLSEHLFRGEKRRGRRETHGGLEGAEELAEERTLRGENEDASLDEGALGVVVFKDHVLL